MSTNSIEGFISQNYNVVYKGDNVNKELRFFGRIGGRILSESVSLSIEQLGV